MQVEPESSSSTPAEPEFFESPANLSSTTSELPPPPGRGLLFLLGSWLLAVALVMLSIGALFFVAPLPPTPDSQAMPSRGLAVLAFFLMAAPLLILGGGLFFARRWARNLAEAHAWMLLVIGVSTSSTLLLLAPPNLDAGILRISAAMTGVLLLVLPALFLLAIRRPRLKATVEMLDPHPSWTDMPMTVLLVGLPLVLSASGVLFIFSQHPLLLKGAASFRLLGIWEGVGLWRVYQCLTGVLGLILGLGLLRRRRAAWLGAIVYMLFTLVASPFQFHLPTITDGPDGALALPGESFNWLAAIRPGLALILLGWSRAWFRNDAPQE
ncbi:MAG: hypothetical protein WC326_13985 [Candidatus Delongbacteria bacterium]